MTTPLLKLRHVCVIEKGGLNPQNHAEEYFAHYSIPAFDDGLRPVLEQGSGIKSQKTVISHGTVLVSKLNPRIPRVWFVNDEQPWRRICSTEFVPFLPDPEKLHPEYLAFALRRLLAGGQIAGSTSAATKSRERVKPLEIAELKIPVPPLTEQRRVVDLLSRAEGIVRLRREAQAKAAEIIPAFFLDMFGDPATNPKGWPVAVLGDHIDLLTGFAFKSDEFVGEGESTRLCRGANVLPQCIDWSDVRYWPNDRVADFERFRLADGDIVLAMDRPWISTGLKVACIGPADLPALLVQRVARIRPLEKLLQEYVYGVLCHRRFALHCNATKTETLVPHISPHDIRSFPVVLAPLEVQKRFAALASQHSSICQQQTAALVKAEAAFQALLSRVFNSDLQAISPAAQEAAIA